MKTQISWGNNMKAFENKSYFLQLCPFKVNPYFQSSNCQRLSTNTAFFPSLPPQEDLLLPLGQTQRLSLGSVSFCSQKFPSRYSLRHLLGIDTEIPEKDLNLAYPVALQKAQTLHKRIQSNTKHST